MSQAQLDQASRVLFQACAVLKDANMALVSTTAYEYVHSELSGFVESWLCEDNWKAEQWITKRYASWSGKPDDGSGKKHKSLVSFVPKEEEAGPNSFSTASVHTHLIISQMFYFT